MKKARKARRYRVSGKSYYLGIPRALTLTAKNKPEAIKLAGVQFQVDKGRKGCVVLK
jgi:hypothetical protein